MVRALQGQDGGSDEESPALQATQEDDATVFPAFQATRINPYPSPSWLKIAPSFVAALTEHTTGLWDGFPVTSQA